MLRAPLLASLFVLPMTLALSGCQQPSPRPARLEACRLSTAPSRVAARVSEATALPTPLAPAAPAPTAGVAPPSPGKAVGSQPAAPPTPVVDAELGVKRLVLARGVHSREPVAPATRFVAAEAERIYAFVEVANPARVPARVHVSFVPPGGRAHGSIALDVGGAPRWRTWAYTRLARETGSWTVVVRDGRGKELGRQRFELAPAAETGA